MARSLQKLNFSKVSHAVSGFLTVMVMPLTYSIAYGLIAGIVTYLVMEGVFRVLAMAGVELPADDEDKHVVGKSLAEITDGNDAVEPEPVKEIEEEEVAENAAPDEEAV